MPLYATESLYSQWHLDLFNIQRRDHEESGWNKIEIVSIKRFLPSSWMNEGITATTLWSDPKDVKSRPPRSTSHALGRLEICEYRRRHVTRERRAQVGPVCMLHAGASSASRTHLTELEHVSRERRNGVYIGSNQYQKNDNSKWTRKSVMQSSDQFGSTCNLWT